SRPHAPDFDGPIPARRSDPFTLGTEGHALDATRMPVEDTDLLGGGIPWGHDFHGRIGTTPGANRQVIVQIGRTFNRHLIVPRSICGHRQEPRALMSVNHSTTCRASASRRAHSDRRLVSRVRYRSPAACINLCASSPPETT